jgi:hypothetical protein
MKPFNLEKALAGEPVVTRIGEEVTQLHLFNASITDYPLVGVLKDQIIHWCKNGKAYTTGGNSHLDLFMAPKVIEGWVNVYQEGDCIWLGSCHESEKAAKDTIAKDGTYIKTIKITNEV